MVVGADRVVRIWWGAQLTSGTQYQDEAFLCTSVRHHRYQHLEPACANTCLPSGTYLPVILGACPKPVTTPGLEFRMSWV
jgi:hypothetical protein